MTAVRAPMQGTVVRVDVAEGDEVFVVDPEACTDCGDCIPACPVECIVNLGGPIEE